METSMLAPNDLNWAKDRTCRLLDRLNAILYGQEAVIQETVCALLSRGHVLLEGLPGLGKTELVKSLAGLLDLDFKRIQFTPDLLPSDVTGTHILTEKPGGRELTFHPGPVFTHILLADEINRASPKTQSALLEAMQERRTTLMGETHRLPDPFFVLATQNPIELEGTYPLPEAQLDRFLFKVEVPGVDRTVLQKILTTRPHGTPPEPTPCLAPEEIQRLFTLVDHVVLPEAVAMYISRLVEATHPDSDQAPDFVKEYVRHGASPRAAIAMGISARARALIRGKPNVGFAEVKEVAASATAHRLVLQFSARLENWSARKVINELVNKIDEVEEALPKTIALPETGEDS